MNKTWSKAQSIRMRCGLTAPGLIEAINQVRTAKGWETIPKRTPVRELDNFVSDPTWDAIVAKYGRTHSAP